MSASMRFCLRQGFTWQCRRVAHQQSKDAVRAQQYCTTTVSGTPSTPSDSPASSVNNTVTSPTPEGADTPREFFRTSEADPALHSLQHEGQFYTIPLEKYRKTLQIGTSKKWKKLVKPFQEASIMVRKPTLEVINYLKTADYSNPPVKYVLYGRKGSGKTMALSHIHHYCKSQGWRIVHLPDANSMIMKHRFNYRDSPTHNGMYDQPQYAHLWMTQFRKRNEEFLNELKTTETYTWSKRESTEKGETLINVVDQGLKRPKNACDAVGVLLKELEAQSHSGAYRMLYSVKAANGLFAKLSAIRIHGGYQVPVAELSLNKHFKKLLQGNWSNGAIVVTVDQENPGYERYEDYKPLSLLKKEGFEFIDPFVPVFVDNYNEKEMESCIEYYIHKRWIQSEQAKTEDGRKQLKFLTENNPGLLNMISANL